MGKTILKRRAMRAKWLTVPHKWPYREPMNEIKPWGTIMIGSARDVAALLRPMYAKMRLEHGCSIGSVPKWGDHRTIERAMAAQLVHGRGAIVITWDQWGYVVIRYGKSVAKTPLVMGMTPPVEDVHYVRWADAKAPKLTPPSPTTDPPEDGSGGPAGDGFTWEPSADADVVDDDDTDPERTVAHTPTSKKRRLPPPLPKTRGRR